MNNKINNYIDVLFSDVPRSKRATELKEEMTANMNDRYEDYIKEGKSETQAYSLTIASMGDIDEMMREVMPDEKFIEEAQYYRKRNARNTGIGVAMYILGFAALIACAIFENDKIGILGVVILLVMAAVATGIIVYSHMSTPLEYKDYDEKDRRERQKFTPEGIKILNTVRSIYWSAMTLIYLAVSFLTFRWEITWIIWPLAAVLFEIIKTVIEMRYGSEK